MRIYLASSWKNREYPKVLAALREEGHHSVFDFRTAGGGEGYRDPEWSNWSPTEYKKFLLGDPAAAQGFLYDYRAMNACDCCVLVLPAGRSAHLESGFFAGRGKRSVVLLSEKKCRQELMYLICSDICTSIPELLATLAK